MFTALTVVSGVAGGLLAAQVWDLDLWRLLVVLAVGTSLGVSVAWATTERARQPVPRVGREPLRPPQAERRPVSDQAVPMPKPEPQPQPSASGGRTWWNETPARAPDTRVEAGTAASPPDYDPDRAVVAQCPRCADFQLDVQRDGDAYAFHCRNPNCGHRWTWRAGSAWPTTVVRRNLTG